MSKWWHDKNQIPLIQWGNGEHEVSQSKQISLSLNTWLVSAQPDVAYQSLAHLLGRKARPLLTNWWPPTRANAAITIYWIVCYIKLGLVSCIEFLVIVHLELSDSHKTQVHTLLTYTNANINTVCWITIKHRPYPDWHFYSKHKCGNKKNGLLVLLLRKKKTSDWKIEENKKNNCIINQKMLQTPCSMSTNLMGATGSLLNTCDLVYILLFIFGLGCLTITVMR